MEYKYCLLKSSWGIVVYLYAEYVEYVGDIFDEEIRQVTDGIWVTYREKPVYHDKFLFEDMPYLEKGIQLVQEQIRAYSKYEETLIIIRGLQFSLCDFQEEGLIATIIEWAAKAFGFECPEIPVEYDRENRRYVYDFDAIRFGSEQHN